ncbi:MAG: S-methyl-5-thioribose-1-phosphate isomerase [Bacteroidales bacterium]|nr:S-methyl-5-thioribose-1-phosphate isomerase [Bacteroidales bacterium]
MKFKEKEYLSVWLEKPYIKIINQALLPFKFQIKTLKTINEVIYSIKNLEVRGAPALGIIGAFSVALSYYLNNKNLKKTYFDYSKITQSRPTAINLKVGAHYIFSYINNSKQLPNFNDVFEKAINFQEKEINACKKIGDNGFNLIKEIYENKRKTVNILVHCNAGWLACGNYGTALAPIYLANKKQIPIHVFVDETRPLNQGSRLTAWELHNEKINFSIIPDNNAGFLISKKIIDLILVGADRIVKNGDVINKIGTYMVALSAYHNNVPFYVAAPLSTFDFNTNCGDDVTIEIRNSIEVRKISGFYKNKKISISIFPSTYNAYNAAFDITPAKFINGYITEKNIYRHVSKILKDYGKSE